MSDEASEPQPKVLYPFFFVVWPPLDLYARNFEEIFLREVLAVLAVFLSAAVILFFGLRLVVGNSSKVGLLLSSVVVVCFTYAAIHECARKVCSGIDVAFLNDHSDLLLHRYLMTFLGAIVVVFGAWILRTRRHLTPTTRPLNCISLLLVSFALLRLVGAAIPGDSGASVTTYAAARALEGDGEHPGRRPDIYYIILDRYGARETLSKAYEFDNREFLERLRAKGFYVANASRSNYAKSALSLWSSLNMGYAPDGFTLRQAVESLLEGHAVGRELRAGGYKYIHLGSWYSPTSLCKDADVNVQFTPREFVFALMKTTPLALLARTDLMSAEDHRAIALFQFKRLGELASTPGPKFVFAHILLPHPPFVFSRDGEPIDRAADDKAAYIEQLEFTNSKMEALVETILTAAANPPLIVLQADEGPSLRDGDRSKPLAAQRKIRSGILNAYLLPASTRRDLYPTISPVNTFRFIFKNVLGKKIDLVEDRIYDWSTDAAYPDVKTYRFEDITDQVLR